MVARTQSSRCARRGATAAASRLAAAYVACAATVLVVVACLLADASATPGIRMALPCGSSLCEDQIGGCAFGHENFECGNTRNAFGKDFEDCLNSQPNFEIPKWNSTKCRDDKTMCELDSDDDGFTNGEELGDPNCTFVADLVANPNNTPPTLEQNMSLLDNVSHPGEANSTPALV